MFYSGHYEVFKICWHIECSILTASSFRILNSSAGVSSPPLALFIVMLPKAHLISHSKMSSSRRVITVLQSWRSSLYNSSVYSCHLFLISSASVRSILFLSFIVPIFAWNVSLASLILKVYIRINFLVIPTSLGKYFVNLSVKYPSSMVFLCFLKGSPHHDHHHHPTFL